MSFSVLLEVVCEAHKVEFGEAPSASSLRALRRSQRRQAKPSAERTQQDSIKPQPQPYSQGDTSQAALPYTSSANPSIFSAFKTPYNQFGGFQFAPDSGVASSASEAPIYPWPINLHPYGGYVVPTSSQQGTHGISQLSADTNKGLLPVYFPHFVQSMQFRGFGPMFASPVGSSLNQTSTNADRRMDVIHVLDDDPAGKKQPDNHQSLNEEKFDGCKSVSAAAAVAEESTEPLSSQDDSDSAENSTSSLPSSITTTSTRRMESNFHKKSFVVVRTENSDEPSESETDSSSDINHDAMHCSESDEEGYKSEYQPPHRSSRKNRVQQNSTGIIRNKLSNEERVILEKWYKKTPYPSRAEYKKLQRELKWPSSVRVAKWFNNRRYNDKIRVKPAKDLTLALAAEIESRDELDE